jgi:tape measure domain-containing protein
MADGKRVSVVVDIVQGKTSGKTAYSDLEKEAKTSAANQERFFKEMNKRLLADTKRVADAEIAVEKAADRERQALMRNREQQVKRFLHSFENASKQSAARVRGIFGSVFAGTFLGQAAFSGVTAGVQRLSSFLKNAFQKSLDFSQMKVSLAQFEGSLAAAEERIKTLNKVAAETPGLSFLSAVEGQKRLEAIGFKGELATKILTGLAKVRVLSGSTKEDFDAMLVNLVQIASGGQKVTQEIREMATRMPALVAIIRKEFGGIGQELNNIDPKVFVERLANAMAKTQADANTAGLAVENFSDAWDRLYVAVGRLIEQNPEVIAAITTFTGILDGNTKGLYENESQVNKTATSWVTSFARATIGAVNFADKAIAVIKDAGNAVGQILNLLLGQWQQALAGAQGFINAAFIVPINLVLAGINKLRSFTGGEQIPLIQPYDVADTFGRGSKRISMAWSDLTSNRSYDQATKRSQQRWSDYDAEVQRLRSATRKPRAGFGNADEKPPILPGDDEKSGKGKKPPKTTDSQFRKFFQDQGFEVERTFGEAINKGSLHPSGKAIDIRIGGKTEDEIAQLIAAALEKGYRLIDERVKQPGVISRGKHLHFEQNFGSKASMFAPGSMYGGVPLEYLRSLDLERLGKVPGSSASIAEWRKKAESPDRKKFLTSLDRLPDEGVGLPEYDAYAEKTKVLAGLYEELDRKLFDLNEHSEKENFLFDVKLGKYPELTQGLIDEIAAQYDLLDARKKATEEAKRLADEQAEYEKKVASEVEQLKRKEYDETRDLIQSSLDYLSRGDLKGFGRSLMERSRQRVVEKGTDWLMEKLGFQNPNDTPELREAKKQTQLLQRLVINTGGKGLGGLISGGQSYPFDNLIAGIGGAGLGGINPTVGGGSISGSLPAGHPTGVEGRGVSGIGGMFGGMFGARKNILTGGMSKMGGIMGGIGDIASMAGGMIGGRWGNLISMAGQGASMGAMFGPWGAAAGAAIGGGIGLIMALMGGDNANKKIKEAALSTYGITLKDKSVINSIKSIGETYFGKGKVGANAAQLMQVDEVKNILRNYASATGQNGEKIDVLSHADPDWQGNQFRGKFGGFRAMGGPVTRGYSYVVGERRAEIFTPSQNGSINPTVGDPQVIQRLMTMLAQNEEVMHMMATRMRAFRPADVVGIAADENPSAFARGFENHLQQDLSGSINLKRQTGDWR